MYMLGDFCNFLLCQFSVTKKRISISSDESWLKELSSESEGEIDNVTEKNLIINNKKNTFFSSSIGNFFTDIGLDCVMSYIQNDLKIAANGKKTLMSSKMFNQNTNNINDLYNFPLKSCHLCNFKTESSIVLNDHMFSLHLNVKNVYHCTFCSFTTPKYMIIVMHLRSSHHIQPRIEPPVFQYLCPLCSFEDNVKSRYNRHISACAKRYNHMENLSPPNEWIPPAKMGLVNIIYY